MHAHNSAWNLLLAGRKRWFLMPAGVLTNMPFSWSDPTHPLTALKALEIRRAEGVMFEITQYPGDVLYIPQGWAHSTLNLCETVAVAQEFCGPNNWEGPPSISSFMYGAPEIEI